MNDRFLLDSWALLALIYDEKPAADRVEQLLRQAADGQTRLFLSLINLGEIFTIIGARRSLEAAQEMVDYIKQLPMYIIPVNEQRVLAAARYKAAYTIAYAAAFAAAAAVEFNAVMVTGDPELLALEDELNLEPLRRTKT